MKNVLCAFACFALFFEGCIQPDVKSGISFEIKYEGFDGPFDGRLLLMLSTDSTTEPRFQLSSGMKGQLVFGIDVADWKPGQPQTIDDAVFGYPLPSLAKIKPGKYFVQGLLHKYETLHRADGKTVKLPMDRGEGQQWNRAPGNIYSKVIPMDITSNQTSSYKLDINQIIPEITPPKDTKYVKHLKIKSERLSAFWGRPMYLGAHVLLPEGFDQHPEAKYPLAIFHGHFPSDFGGFSENPPDPNMLPEYSARFDVEGYNKIVAQEAHDFYKAWTSDEMPRMIIVKIQHANPYYDDSYAVNSENLGPYGDAITYELIPHIEAQFRGIGEGWARFLYGGSTGGWEALAAQVFYPDEYNGCFAACPDPIDFRAFTLIDIYEDQNAYTYQGEHKVLKKPGHRDYLGHVDRTIEDDNHLELVLGTKSRSGGQYDIWEAVYSPNGADGYPARIWDKKTGEIDANIASYWKENYDLRHILERDWDKLGHKLKGKIHIYCGDMDNYYLNNAVYLMEAFLEGTTSPYYEGEVAYGDRAEHCWNGDPDNPNHISRLRYNTMYIPKMLKRIEASAPQGADVTSWRY